MGKWVQLAPPYVGYAIDEEQCLVWRHEGIGLNLRKVYPKFVALVEFAGGQVFVDEVWLPQSRTISIEQG